MQFGLSWQSKEQRCTHTHTIHFDSEASLLAIVGGTCGGGAPNDAHGEQEVAHLEDQHCAQSDPKVHHLDDNLLHMCMSHMGSTCNRKLGAAPSWAHPHHLLGMVSKGNGKAKAKTNLKCMAKAHNTTKIKAADITKGKCAEKASPLDNITVEKGLGKNGAQAVMDHLKALAKKSPQKAHTIEH